MNFSPDSRFMRLCGSFVSLVRINLLWLLCSLPLFTVGASTAAMVSALTAFRADDECGAKVFFRAFRTHFRQATVLWLLMAFLGCMLALDYRIVVHLAFPVKMAVIVVICFCALALILVSGLIFPLLVRFPGTLRDTVINAVLLSIAHLPKMLLVTAMNLLPLLLLVLLPRVVLFFGFLWPVCGFSLVALYDLKVIEKIFAILESRAQEPAGQN